jgi:hypothetical protein
VLPLRETPSFRVPADAPWVSGRRLRLVCLDFLICLATGLSLAIAIFMS